MRRKRLLPFGTAEVEEGTYWISISDLMSGLLTIFILTLTWYILTYSQITTSLMKSEDKRTEILRHLQEELQKHGITVKIDVDNGVLHLPEHILFDPGEAQLKEKGIQAVKIIGPILEKSLNSSEYYGSVETVFIEGHTDNSPIFFKFPSNWELSAQRAINTWKELSQATPGLVGMKNKRRAAFIFLQRVRRHASVAK
jgi:Flagellar motor protein